MRLNIIFSPRAAFFALYLLLLPAAAFANGSASLQFTVAAPDPVMAGDEILFQTLVVNTGVSAWAKGNYYWMAEVYDLQGEEKKFITQTAAVTPDETVQAGAAHGVQIPFLVPEMFGGHRLLYRVFLYVDGRRLLETEYKGFQVTEREFKPPAEKDIQLGGDITFTYKNSSPGGWDNHQGITSANMVGKVKQSSFIFNTYLLHTYHRPITANLIFLNYYAPWGTLSLGDVYPTLTPLSMDGQGMRGAAFERTRDKVSWTLLAGRIVSPEEPTINTSGRFSRYTGGFKVSYQARPDLKITLNSVLSRDDEYSITQDTRATVILPQQSFVYGGMVDWKVSREFSFMGDFQNSSYSADINAGSPKSGSAWKQELKWRGKGASARAAYSRVDAKFMSFASPSVIPDRETLEAEAGLPVTDWTSFSLSYNSYVDNLENDPAKNTTRQTQNSLTNTSRLFGRTMLTASGMLNTALGKSASVQDNKTTTLSLSVMQPVGANTLNATGQQSAFRDNTGFSHGLDTRLLSLSGSFKMSRRLSVSAGLVKSETKDRVDSSKSKNDTLNGNLAYAIPKRSVAFQLWASMATGSNNSALAPADYGSLSLNFETVWMRSKSSKITFGAGAISKTDKLYPANDGTTLNLLTRYNYSF